MSSAKWRQFWLGFKVLWCLTIEAWGAFYLHGLTLIPAWISNRMPCKVWDEIIYSFLNLNGCTVKFKNGQVISSHTL